MAPKANCGALRFAARRAALFGRPSVSCPLQRWVHLTTLLPATFCSGLSPQVVLHPPEGTTVPLWVSRPWLAGRQPLSQPVGRDRRASRPWTRAAHPPLLPPRGRCKAVRPCYSSGAGRFAETLLKRKVSSNRFKSHDSVQFRPMSPDVGHNLAGVGQV